MSYIITMKTEERIAKLMADASIRGYKVAILMSCSSAKVSAMSFPTLWLPDSPSGSDDYRASLLTCE